MMRVKSQETATFIVEQLSGTIIDGLETEIVCNYADDTKRNEKGKGKGKGMGGKGKVDGKAGHVAGAAYAHDAVEPSKKDLDPQSWGQRGWSAGWKGKDKGNDKGKGWWGGS
mmetsp:Transcript_15248/g.43314  ORF Transcript_15248/g.43314 Transcript_15248/m.43314 type:complete len:112 (+) Transcript_15248:2-337(+)